VPATQDAASHSHRTATKKLQTGRRRFLLLRTLTLMPLPMLDIALMHVQARSKNSGLCL